ncbi:MAG: LytTR family transcriptional regulator DNA-binding domain-containing protein [Proteobacteria bacterium]|nr:LytTR family transcriptional regulator DNA-binding domain-containing protein [Pseudomonadota bacterium]
MSEPVIDGRTALLRQVVIDLAVIGVVGLVLAFLGPFGTFASPFGLRLIYWLGLSLTGYACFRPITGLVTRWGARLGLPEVPLLVAACLVASVPMTAVVLATGQLPAAPRWPTLSEAIAQYGLVLVIGSAVTVLFHILSERSGTAASTPAIGTPTPDAPGPSAVEEARFLARIPPTRAEDLLALEMEDHYLRAHTRQGSHLILLRMRDALAELEGIDGLRVHRSWWVARHAVASTLRDGRSMRLRLISGQEVPVARDAVAQLKEAGWLTSVQALQQPRT